MTAHPLLPRTPMPKIPVRPRALPPLAALASAAAWLPATPALAHEGHGLPGHAHWHATDVLGFVALAVGVAALVWWRGRK